MLVVFSDIGLLQVEYYKIIHKKLKIISRL